ncbi:glycosyltransferase family 2 protein [Pseudocolwellia sp. HL-MZ19]|uniref:glycosyltransferase family 2 protein n=1 Tax=Pseudocolwellia sp. HL-MZ19 TaxID=3400846 RepID=UPI003CEFA5BB
MSYQNTEPKITVITGYYNRAHALEHTIDSILQQTFTDFELIVFNDNSTDNTETLLEQLIDKYNDPRLIVINHPENKGFVQGMIDAIKIAKGEYICVQGSGDYSYPERLELQSTLLDNETDVGAVGCFYENYVEDRNIIRERKKEITDLSFNELMKGNVFSHGEVMFRKTTYEAVGGYRPEFINCQDYDLWLRIIKIAKLASVPNVLYKRYIRYDGVSYKPSKFLKQTRYFYLCKLLAQLSDKEQIEILNKLNAVGLENLVTLNSFNAQKMIVNACLRFVVWEEFDAAKTLTQEGINNKLVRGCLYLFIHIYKSKLANPFRSFINYKLGINVEK